MINTSDPLERLRVANPVPADLSTVPGPDRVLLNRIIATEPAVARRPAGAPAPRRARWLVPALLVTGVLGGAVAYAVLNDQVTRPHQVACYEAAGVEARTELVRVDERGPLEACAGLWRRGVLGRGGDVPDLAECVLGSGVAAVFPAPPGDDTCRRLLGAGASAEPGPAPAGSTPPPVQNQAEVNARFLAFRDAVLPQFLQTRCMDPAAGAAIVGRELAAAGLAGWTVRGGDGLAGDGFSPVRPCATLSFEPERREVVLVPAPPRP